ncbi:hypothetical protein GCM10010272_48980 [Streptomyces lateritius]|nr:hypothetical protein GCM10010272_48980 [Streptomyces lateritius]
MVSTPWGRVDRETGVPPSLAPPPPARQSAYRPSGPNFVAMDTCWLIHDIDCRRTPTEYWTNGVGPVPMLDGSPHTLSGGADEPTATAPWRAALAELHGRGDT